MRPSVLVLALVWAMELTQQDGLLHLTDTTFEEARTRFPALLVHFHAPMCSICRNVTLDLVRISEEYRTLLPTFRTAQLDAATDLETARKMNITGFPTLLLLDREEIVQYRGALADLGNWVRWRILPSALVLNSSEAVADFVRVHAFATVLFASPDSEPARVIATVAKTHPELNLALVTATDLNDLWKMPFPSLVVNNVLDNVRFTYAGSWTAREVHRFISLKSVRVKLQWGDAAAEYVFVQQHPALLFYRSNATALTFEKTLAPVWRLGRIPFIELDFTVYQHQVLMDFLGIERQKYPNILIVHVKDGEVLKYAMKEEITAAGVTAFIEAWELGKTPRFLRSEWPPRPFPDRSLGALLELTGLHYPEATSKPGLHALIWVYSPGCPSERVFEEVAAEFRKRDKLLVGRINGAKNDLQGLRITSFPLMVLYPAGAKDPLVYTGSLSAAEMITFVKTVTGG